MIRVLTINFFHKPSYLKMVINIFFIFLILNVFICIGLLEKKTSFFRKCLCGLFVSIIVCLPIFCLWIFDYHLTTDDQYSSSLRDIYCTAFYNFLISLNSINIVLLIAISLLLFLILVVWFMFFRVAKKDSFS